jgi:uncharacterized membrane protein
MPSLDISTYPRVATPVAVVGATIVFLLTCAALANAEVRHLVLPDALRKGAVIVHLSTVLLALPLGISQLVLPKGTTRHRIVGYVWCALMVTTAVVSFAVHEINPGGLSPVHLFSVMTLVIAPLIVFTARTGRIERHRRAALGLMLGGLTIAGLFTFVPSRALGGLMFQLFHIR